MGRCLVRTRYRLSRLNRVEFMVLLSCIACIFLLIYAVGLHEDNKDLLVLQDSNTNKEPAQPNAKRGRRSITDFTDQNDSREPVVDKKESAEQYEFMEIQDFDTDNEKSSNINVKPDEDHQGFQHDSVLNKQEIKAQTLNHNIQETKKEFHFDARDSELIKEETVKRPVGSKVYPLPDNAQRIDIYAKTLGKDYVNNPIVPNKGTNNENDKELHGGNSRNSQDIGNIQQDLVQMENNMAQVKREISMRESKSNNLLHSQRRLYVQATGGLGAKLFQYASLVGIAKQTGRHAVITPDSDLMYSFQKLSAETGYIPSSTDIAQIHEERNSKFSPHLLSLPLKDTLLCCYLQSWRYFQIYEDFLRNDFIFSDGVSDKARSALRRTHLYHQTKTQRLKKVDPTVKDYKSFTYIGVHVRRGDYANKYSAARGYVTASVSYITKALAYFRNKFDNALFIVCSDDIKWCKNNINGSDVEFVSTGEPVVDLALLTQCKHTVITVGAFGWWAGWLTGGEVVYYNNWPKPGSELDANVHKKDYFLTTWLPMGD